MAKKNSKKQNIIERTKELMGDFDARRREIVEEKVHQIRALIKRINESLRIKDISGKDLKAEGETLGPEYSDENLPKLLNDLCSDGKLTDPEREFVTLTVDFLQKLDRDYLVLVPPGEENRETYKGLGFTVESDEELREFSEHVDEIREDELAKAQKYKADLINIKRAQIHRINEGLEKNGIFNMTVATEQLQLEGEKLGKEYSDEKLPTLIKQLTEEGKLPEEEARYITAGIERANLVVIEKAILSAATAAHLKSELNGARVRAVC